MELKEKISVLRAMKEMTQSQLADAVGVTRRAIINYESGFRVPRKSTLLKLAEVFGMGYSELVSEEENFLIEVNEKHGSKGKSDAEKLLQNANALFAGGDISEEDKELLIEALQESYWKSKLINKKYTPKKYLNNKSKNEKNSDN